MVSFLQDIFRFNEDANLRLTEFVSQLPENGEMLRHLSHLANCQYKWLDRIRIYPGTSGLDWWLPEYSVDELRGHFRDSTAAWIDFLSERKEEDLGTAVPFIGMDGSNWEASVKDIALQLNFHSFHHRAQVNLLIRQAGHKPPFIDYIRTHSKKQTADS